MSYKSLYKLFVMNDIETFNKFYYDRFNSNSTIKFDLFNEGYQSFFNYDSDIMSIVSKIDNINLRLNSVFSELPLIAQDQYFRKSLVDEIHFTNQIEGVISTRKEISDLINEIEQKVVTKNRFVGIVNKYLMLMKDDIKINDSNDIRKLYDEMLYEEIKSEDANNLPDGLIFRKDQVHVYKSGEKIVHNGIMPESKIIEYMDKAIKILNDESINILIRVSIFHYLFGYIHPFYDGNGRINRFISSYVLSKYYNNIIGFRLSLTIKDNLSLYLDAFDNTNDIRNRFDVSLFVHEYLSIIYKSFEKTEIYALEKKQEYNKYNNILNVIKDKLYELKNKREVIKLLSILIQASIFGDFGLSKKNIIEIMKKGDTTINKYIIELKKLNLCVDFQSGRHHYYKANLEELEKINVNL